LLRELCLHGINTCFPGKNLANLRVVDLMSYVGRYRTTKILDFLESAPLLHTVSLRYPMPDASDAPPERIVPLRHLKVFTIITDPLPSILLHHLHIPTGASLTSEFFFRGEGSPLSDYLTKRYLNFGNLSNISTINLYFNLERLSVRLSGPSGSLRLLASWKEFLSYATQCQILRSLHPILSATRTLAISDYTGEPVKVGDCPILHTLSSTNDLRTLILTGCSHQPFIRALDPEQHPSNLVLCSNLEELVFYLKCLDQLQAKNVLGMARCRASRGAKLSSIMFVNKEDAELSKEMSELREHVVHVEYRVSCEVPLWDKIPGGSGGESE
jgi:hypothetical protein